MSSNFVYSQLGDYALMVDTLLNRPVESGFLWWKQPNTYIPGECFQQYRLITGDTMNNAVLEKSWVDNDINMSHYKYRQTYKGVPVEGAVVIEHFTSSNKLIFTNGNLAIELDENTSPQLTENQAKQALLNYFPSAYVMAWNDSNWEQDLKTESGDPYATYEPTGELILALEDHHNLDFYIPAEKYRLAYKFEVLVVSPYINSNFYVDANTGVVFKEISNIHEDGLATVVNSPGAGTQTIDTRPRGWPNNDFVLETDNGVIKIHTKKWAVPSWILRSEINKSSEPWTGFEINATSAHWHVERAWKYFRDTWGLDGMNGSNANIRVHVEKSGTSHNAFYDRHLTTDNITFIIFDGNTTGNYPDVVGHEYTHGVINYSSELEYVGESGALNESFADIFGEMVERYSILGGSGSPDWIVGNDDLPIRSLSNPKSAGAHGELDGGSCVSVNGQPDTYFMINWQSTDIYCDNGGVHGNSGVQNHWFYLIAEGGYGTNDNLDNYDIESLGIDVAARIAYWNMTNVLTESSGYPQARAGSRASAELLYGPCSNQFHQTTNAWYAVGVGNESTCEEVLSLNEITKLDDLIIYPNPSTGQFTINWEESENFDITIFKITGQFIFQLTNVFNNTTLSLNNTPPGVYIIEIKGENSVIRKRLVIE